MMRRRWFAPLAAALAAAVFIASPVVATAAPDTTSPTSTVKLVFIHHSTGQAWLADGHGGLGAALGANNYFVNDTNYGWGPSSIGDRTDIGDWWTWFRGPNAATYTTALYGNTGQYCSYTRTLSDPGGENTVVMFKSCYPNSQVGGTPGDTIPAIEANPLAGHGMSSLTVGNAKSVYLDLLEYFRMHPEKLFVLVVSPPEVESRTNATQAANARALANWLVDPDGLLHGYAAGNVSVFDYYTVLTGGHHRIVGSAVEHTVGATNYSIYGSSSGDSHPNAEGDQVATNEFVPMLNAAYNAWRTGSALPPASALPISITRSPRAANLTFRRHRGIARFTLGATFADAHGRVSGARVWLQKSPDGRTWKNAYRLRTSASGKAAARLTARRRGVAYYRWYVPATATHLAASSPKQRVHIR